jgi:hypothetical protein
VVGEYPVKEKYVGHQQRDANEYIQVVSHVSSGGAVLRERLQITITRCRAFSFSGTARFGSYPERGPCC